MKHPEKKKGGTARIVGVGFDVDLMGAGRSCILFLRHQNKGADWQRYSTTKRTSAAPKDV